jgi:hypothetical protein
MEANLMPAIQTPAVSIDQMLFFTLQTHNLKSLRGNFCADFALGAQRKVTLKMKHLLRTGTAKREDCLPAEHGTAQGSHRNP